MRIFYTLCALLCLQFFNINSAEAQAQTYNIPCYANNNPVDLTAVNPQSVLGDFDNDLSESFFTNQAGGVQTFGGACGALDSTLFAKVTVDPLASALTLTHLNGSATDLKVFLISMGDPCTADSLAPTFGTYMETDLGLNDCALDVNSPVEFDLCALSPTEKQNLFLMVSVEDLGGPYGDFEIQLDQTVAPANDECSAATNMGTLNSGGQLCLNGEDNINACPETGFTASCYSNFTTESTVWYTFTTGAGVEHISVELTPAGGAAGADDLTYALIELPSGCGMARANVVNAAIDGEYCEELVGSNDMLEQLPVRAGTTYYILVSSPDTDEGEFDICVESYTTPANDLICNATTVTLPSPGSAITESGTTEDAAIFWTDPSTKSWESFDCPGAAPGANPYSAVFYKLDVDPYVTRIQIQATSFSGSGSLSGQIFEFDQTTDCPAYPHTTIQIPTQASTGDCDIVNNMLQFDMCDFTGDLNNLYLYVSSDRLDQGTFDINFWQEVAPPNDLCDDPSDPARGPEDLGTLTLGNTECATELSNRGACGDPNLSNPACATQFANEASIWYEFMTGPNVEQISAEIEHATASNVRLMLFELPMGCGNNAQVHGPAMIDEYCSDDPDMDGIDSIVRLSVRPNQTYYLVVSTDSTEWGDFTSVCVNACDPPANNYPCNATVLTLNTDPDIPLTQMGTTNCATPLYTDDNLAVLQWGDGCPEDQSTVYYKLDVDDYATVIEVFGESLTPGVNFTGRIVEMTMPACARPTTYGASTYPQPDATICDFSNGFARLDLCGFTIAQKDDIYLEISSDRLNTGQFELNIYQEIAPVNDQCDDPSSAARQATDLGQVDVGVSQCLTAETNRGACPDNISGGCFAGFNSEATVWYRFSTGPDVELLSIDVNHYNGQEVRLGLFQLGTAGSCADPVQPIPAADYPADYCVSNTSNGVDSVWKVLVQQNTDYFVAVSTDTSNWGEFDICVKNCAPPANDKFCDFEVLIPGEEDETNRNERVYPGTSVCANNFFSDNNLNFYDFMCAPAESSVFYKIDVDPNATEITISGTKIDPINTFSAALIVPLGGACPGTPRTHNPAVWVDAMGTPMQTCDLENNDLVFDLCPMSTMAKDSIYLWVGTERKDQGEFEIEVSQKIGPENDKCVNATVIQGETGTGVNCVNGTNLFACPDDNNLSMQPPGGAMIGCYVDTPGTMAPPFDHVGVWFEFTTDAIGELLDLTVSHTNGNDVNIALFAKDPDCANLLPVLCEQDNDDDGIIDDIVNYGINPDTTYLMFVYTADANWGDFEVCYNIKQVPPCDGDPPRFFNHTTPICGLDALNQFCIDMTSGNDYPFSGQSWPGCSSWALHNPNWFSFIAGADMLEISIDISDCDNNQGTQVAMYELPCDQEFDPSEPGINPETLAGDIVSNCSFAACNTGNVTFTAVTEVGQLYGIVFDGCNGDVCNIEIEITVGGDPPELDDDILGEPTFPDDELGFNEDTICLGATDVPFMVDEEVPGSCRFIWSLNGDTIPGSTNMATEFIDFVDPLMPGIHEVCVSASNYCDTTEPVCIEVLVLPLDPYYTTDTICEGESYTWIGPFGNTLGTYGPFNGNTGNMNYQTTTMNSYMCEIPAELDLYVINENDENPTPIDTFVCFSDLPYSIFGVDITGPVTDFDVQTISPFTGCDTFFAVDLTVFGGNFFIQPNCDGLGNVIFSIDLLEDPQLHTNWFEQFQIFENDPDFSFEYEWTVAGQGGVLDSAEELTLSQQEIEDLAINGILTLRLQLNMYYKGDLFCSPISPPFEYDLSLNFPEILNITGDTTYCPGQQNLKLYSAVQDPIAPSGGFPDPISFYQWYPPNGFTIDSPYTSTTDTISLTSPNSPTDNTVCLVVTTGSCMFTDSLCIELEEQTPDQPVLEPDNQTCDTTWTFNPSFASSGGWSIIDTPPTGNTAYFVGPTNNPNATVNVSEPGVYTFEWREGPTDCALYDTVTIEFLENPESVSYVDTCYFGVNFVVEIDFDGGTPGYTIDPASTITGDLDPNTGIFVSDTIIIDFDPVTGNYGDVLQLIITDANGCVSDTVDITLVCECESEIGDMATDLIELCEGDVATANYLGGHTNDGDDTLVYILHRGDTTELVGILDTSLNGEFTFDPGSMNYGTTYYISRVIGNAVNQYVDLDDPCLDVAEGQPVVWYEVPVADAGNDTTVCGFSYSLNANPSVGDGMWKLVPSDPSVSIADPTDPSTMVTVNNPGTYTFRWTETNEICQDSADVTVELTGEIIPITSTICNALATEYDIKIILTGGGGDYFIEDFVDSSLVDSLYMVADTIFATGIPKDSVVTFTINNQLGCGPVVLPVTTACVCETQVGTLESQVLQACSDGCIDANILNYDTTGQYLDPNDSLSFVMHTSTDDTLLASNFIAQSASGIFCYSNVMNSVAFGDTVYISVIAGNHIGGGRVDINDPCQQITFGAPAVFNERPVANAGPDQDICGLDGSLSAVASVGDGSWTYVSGPSANANFGDPTSASTTVTVDAYGTHTFAWTEDNFTCDASDTVELTFLDFPNATNITFMCDDIASSYVVTFELENGDTSSYSVTGDPGTLNGNVFTSDPIPHDSTYIFYVFDGNQCDTTEVTGSHFCPCITEIGALTGPTQDLCRNEGVSGVSYDGTGEVRDANDGLLYVLLDGSGNVIVTSPTPNFFFNPSTMNLGETYYIRVYLGSVIGGDFQFDERCTLSDGDIEVTWYDFPEAIITAQFDTLTCTRTSIDLDGSSSIGNNLTYSWEGGNVSGSTTPVVTITQPGTYTLTVTDPLSGCTDEVDYVIEKSADIPDAIIEDPMTLTCTVTEITLDGSQSSSGATIVYEWTASPGNITGPTDQITTTVDAPGQYTLTVIDNANNCRISETVTVEQDIEQPTVQASVSDELSCSITQVDLNGNGSSTGSEFSYQWSTSNGNITGSSTSLSTTADSVGDYTLVITNTENGCVDSVTVSVTRNPNALTGIDVEANDPRCHNEINGNISITPMGGQQPITYTLVGEGLQNNTGSFTNLGPGTYTIEVEDVNGCFETETVTLVNPPLLSIDLPQSIIIEEGDSVIIEAILPPGAIYDTLVWDTDTVPYVCLDSACTIIELRPLNTVEVIASVIGGVGCSDEDAMKIVVRVVRDVYIPNVFTPNGDGLNDRFLPATGRRVVSINNMQIYDRWGSMIFESRNFQPGQEEFGWDGTYKGEELQPAVFVYKVEVEYDNGDIDILNGTVTLTR